MSTRRKFTLATIAAALTVAAMVVPALADNHHGRPSVCAQPAQIDEAGFGSRDGFDHFHFQPSAQPGSLVELEGWHNVCRTNDAVVAENTSATARAVRVDLATRVALRSLEQRWNGSAWVSLTSSVTVNTGAIGNPRTVAITTALLTEAGVGDPSTDVFEPGWYRVEVRAAVRLANGAFASTVQHTYPVWFGDGPVTPATPPS